MAGSSVAPEFDDRRLMGRYLESRQHFHGASAMEKYNSAMQNIDRQAVHERMAREIANTGKQYHSAIDKIQRKDLMANTAACVRKGGSVVEEKMAAHGPLKYTQNSGEALTAMDHQVCYSCSLIFALTVVAHFSFRYMQESSH